MVLSHDGAEELSVREYSTGKDSITLLGFLRAALTRTKPAETTLPINRSINQGYYDGWHITRKRTIPASGISQYSVYRALSASSDT